ncbi:hypothetical protein IM40_10400 (plasmid) [Candidatus Paracaedimonas acanthamoebae]|nr:hypothetical protein IM40_10400 [Candidatus Paracaedimonas acanthamoebae]
MNKIVQSSQPQQFQDVLQLITEAKEKVWKQANKVLIELYWDIGRYVSQMTIENGWGKNTVQEMAEFILAQDPSIKGFSPRNIWRMKQFYETYQGIEKLSAALTEISWSNHLHILSKTKTIEEKEFYLTFASQHYYSERDFARLIDSGTYERTRLADKKLSAALTEFPINTKGIFKDSYIFEFLEIQEHSREHDLRKALLRNFRKFLLELGPDFSLIGEEYVLQVGMKDFRVDLLMHHRALNCLVAIELKITDFKPEHLGKLQFYLEALDRQTKKPHENPSIGILICKTKDEEVVEYALNRHLSPTMIAEYETKLINKELLRQKVHDLTQSLAISASESFDE